jgi:hypothetical protein
MYQPSGEIYGLGPMAAWVIRDLIMKTGGQPGTTFRGVVFDDATGTFLGATRPTYRPPGGLVDHIRLRDRTCRYAGCRRAAEYCDVDHVVPWKGDGHTGQTCEQNLECLCRRHHRMKHHRDWEARINGSDIEWTSPTGHHYTTTAYDWRDYTPSPEPEPDSDQEPAFAWDEEQDPAWDNDPTGMGSHRSE